MLLVFYPRQVANEQKAAVAVARMVIISIATAVLTVLTANKQIMLLLVKIMLVLLA